MKDAERPTHTDGGQMESLLDPPSTRVAQGGTGVKWFLTPLLIHERLGASRSEAGTTNGTGESLDGRVFHDGAVGVSLSGRGTRSQGGASRGRASRAVPGMWG